MREVEEAFCIETTTAVMTSVLLVKKVKVSEVVALPPGAMVILGVVEPVPRVVAAYGVVGDPEAVTPTE
jgi:hypothetical protein